MAELPARRVVSLCPSLTELVVALGAGDVLVGRTKFCTWPAGVLESVPQVGGTKDPRVDRVLARDPDLVLMNEEENRREDHDALVAAGMRCATFLPRGVDDVPPMVRRVGELLARVDEAERLARAVEERAAGVRARRAGAGRTFAYLIWRGPWMVVGGGTYVSALLEETGARNAFPERGYPAVTADEISRHAPDVVLLASEPFPFAPRHAEELAAATGIGASRMRCVDGRVLSWHGPSTLEGLATAEELLAG